MVKRLYIDIECSPEKVYTYDRYEASIVGKVERSILLSVAWKWEGEKMIHCLALSDFQSFKKDNHDDKELADAIWKIVDEADIIIGHNGKNFDIKKLNTYFIYHSMTPPAPYKAVDTLLIARRKFKFFGNSLDDLAGFFGIGKKIETEKGLWRECLDGSKSAFHKLKTYNKHDVWLLVEVYKRLLPWIDNHPHVDPEMGEHACPNCGSKNIRGKGKEILVSGIKRCLKCYECGRRFYGKLQREQ